MTKNKLSVDLDPDSADSLVRTILLDSLRFAEKDERLSKFPDEDRQKYIEAVKVVIDWFSPPNQWGKYK